MNSTLPDILLYCIQQDGYSTGTTAVYQYGEIYQYVEASRDGERWVVIAEDRYEALVELMVQLGWDLMD